jgi:hypothetical protein
MSNENTRSAVLQEAIDLINGPRAQAYGPPEVNFANIAKGWSVIVGQEVTPEEVALCMAWLKIARVSGSGEAGRDSYTDGAAYMALAAELANV